MLLLCVTTLPKATVLFVQVCVHCHGGTGPVAGVMPRSLPQPVCGELSQDGAKAA